MKEKQELAKIKKQKIVRDELKRIASTRKGKITPQIVLANARNKKSVLHKYFDWDDTIAAKKYRLWQARQLISVSVEVIPHTNKEMRSFFNVKDESTGKSIYVTSDLALKVPDYVNQLISDAQHHISRLSNLLELLSKEYVKRKKK